MAQLQWPLAKEPLGFASGEEERQISALWTAQEPTPGTLLYPAPKDDLISTNFSRTSPSELVGRSQFLGPHTLQVLAKKTSRPL